MSCVLKGKGVSQGVCAAKILTYKKAAIVVPDTLSADPVAEIARFHDIIRIAKDEIIALQENALHSVGRAEADIFDAHLTILEDTSAVIEPIEGMIAAESLNAAKAIEICFNELIELFSTLEDPLIKERAADAKDLKERLLQIALGIKKFDFSAIPQQSIIVAKELTPSDTVQMDLKKIVGIATIAGGVTSHTAIIARTLGIPAVVAVEGIEQLEDGQNAILDGVAGTLIVSPSEEDMAVYQTKKQLWDKQTDELLAYVHRPSMTPDGVLFELAGNIGLPEDVDQVIQSGADGIGLFRTEFLFMNEKSLPTEDEQYEVYKSVLQKMNGMPVTIRTIDIGGDKDVPMLNLKKEENPFLGFRAIRLCMNRLDLFLPQLRALLRAAVFGRLRILLPMISGMDELCQIKQLIRDVESSLLAEGYLAKIPEIGVMIEIPSAALMADKIAKEVDFFSIGTNDLTQYTLAVERGNDQVEHLYTPYHPAVIQLIALASNAANKNDILCGMCGEAAGYSDMLPLWAGLGLRELSASPHLVPRMRKSICDLDLNKAQRMAEEVLDAETPEQVKLILDAFK